MNKKLRLGYDLFLFILSIFCVFYLTIEILSFLTPGKTDLVYKLIVFVCLSCLALKSFIKGVTDIQKRKNWESQGWKVFERSNRL